MTVRIAELLDSVPAHAFAQRIEHAPNPRLAAALTTLIGVLSKLIQDSDTTHDDLRAVISFMTDVGEACQDNRQEWVLLADVLGLSSAVVNQNSKRPVGTTPNTLTGPFYRLGAPLRASGESISIDGVGDALCFVATVLDLDRQPIAGAMLEIWHANGEGLYENQVPDRQPDFNLRGKYQVDETGVTIINTIRPKGYAIPADGPVGILMKNLGLQPNRPAHFHFRISMPGFQTLTTHVFDQDDTAIASDPLFAVHANLAAKISRNKGGKFAAEFCFILARSHPGRENI